MEEVWKVIPDYPDYEVSNLGRVRRIYYLDGSMTQSGYKAVRLSYNGVQKTKNLHRLVAEMFLEKPDTDEKLVVNHIDGDKSNNCVDNLEWITQKENVWHARDILGKQMGGHCQSQRILVEFLDGSPSMEFESINECARQLGLTAGQIYQYLKSNVMTTNRMIQAKFSRIE